MAKTTKKKLNSYTEKKNGEPPVEVVEAKVIEEVNLPETKAMVPVKSFAMPLATVNQVKEAMKRYQEFNRALLTSKDLYEVVDKKTGEKKMVAKKSGFAKLGRFWGVSTEILRSFTEEKEVLKDKWVYSPKSRKSYLIAKKGDKYLLAKAWAKAILPNGQFAVRGAAIAETERNFAHLDHDLLATSETRAVKRATEAVIGMGEIITEDEVEEEEFKETEQKPNKKELIEKEQPNDNPEPELKYEEYEFNGKKYMRAIKDGQVIREGIDLDEWKPIFKSRPVKYGGGYPASPNMEAGNKQLGLIADKIKNTGIPPEDIIFILNNRIDGKPRGKMLIDFDKGDAHDVIEAIKRKKIKIVKKTDGKIEAIIG